MNMKADAADLEPAPVERGLVGAIQEHRDEWPLIYNEMKSVDKDDLLADAEYCNRHKHPSMTQFFCECGSIAGIHESMLRKFERAGRFYDRFHAEFPDSPEITDPKVVAMSPDTLILVDRIDSFLQKGAPRLIEERKKLLRKLVGDLLEGCGLRRKELNAWLASLQDADEYGHLKERVYGFLYSLYRDGSVVNFHDRIDKLRCLESIVRIFLEEGTWLESLGARATKSWSRGLEIVDSPRVRDRLRTTCPDFVVVESFTDDLAVHFVEVKVAVDRHKLSRVLSAFGDGADYNWLALGALPSDDVVARCKEASVGIMLVSQDRKEVILSAEKLSSSENARVRLYRGLMAASLGKRNKPTPSYEYFSFQR